MNRFFFIHEDWDNIKLVEIAIENIDTIFMASTLTGFKYLKVKLWDTQKEKKEIMEMGSRQFERALRENMFCYGYTMVDRTKQKEVMQWT